MRGSFWTVCLGLVLVACGQGPEPLPGPAPRNMPRYQTLPDTLVCVVDRTTERGLRAMQGKVLPEGEVVVLTWDGVRPLDEIHPISLIAGYAGGEPWYSSRQAITVQSRRYTPVEGERKIGLESLRSRGDYQGIPLFADPGDPNPPLALYVPVRPGCIFQAYVRQ